MKKIVLGIAIIATTLISADLNRQVSTHTLAKERVVPSGLGNKKPKVKTISKSEAASLYKNKCKKCHGKRGEGRRHRSRGARDLKTISRSELQKNLFYYAGGKPVHGRYSNIMKDQLKSVSIQQIKALAKYISEDL